MCKSAQKRVVLEEPSDLNVFFISGFKEKNKLLWRTFKGRWW